jgi:NitT/TauT family transport system substrate-binding protein
MQQTSRIPLRRRAVFAVAGLALGLGAAGPAFAQDAFAVGLVPGDVTSLAPRFAQAAGTYANHRIKAELVTIEGGSRGVQVLLAGKLQAMQVGFSVAVNANREGADLRLITSSSNVMPMDIYVNSNVKSAADLKGQKIAVSAFTSESDMAVSLALQQLKLTRKDVTVVPLGGASQRLAAQMSGQVLAAPYVSPATAMAKERGLNLLVDLGKDGAPWVFNGLVVSRDVLKSNPDLLKRFVKANVEGIYKALSDEKWAREVIAKEFKTTSKAVIDDAYDTLKRFYPRDFTPSAAAVGNVINEVHTMGPALSSRDAAQYVDLTIVEALRKEGFFDEMKKRYGL